MSTTFVPGSESHVYLLMHRVGVMFKIGKANRIMDRACLLFVVCLMTFSQYAHACSCAPRQDSQRLTDAEYVYVGIAKQPIVQNGNAIAPMQIEQTLKGKALAPKLRSVSASSWMCDRVVEAGSTYLVYGRNGVDPVLSVCSDSVQLLPHNAQSRIEKLRTLLNGRK